MTAPAGAPSVASAPAIRETAPASAPLRASIIVVAAFTADPNACTPIAAASAFAGAAVVRGANTARSARN